MDIHGHDRLFVKNLVTPLYLWLVLLLGKNCLYPLCLDLYGPQSLSWHIQLLCCFHQSWHMWCLITDSFHALHMRSSKFCARMTFSVSFFKKRFHPSFNTLISNYPWMAFSCLLMCVCAGARQTPVMSVSTRVSPMLWETDGGQTNASYVTVYTTSLFSVPPTVHTLSVDAHR